MNDDAYYYRRAEQELAMAHKAACESSAYAHYMLANMYRDLFDSESPAQAQQHVSLPLSKAG